MIRLYIPLSARLHQGGFDCPLLSDGKKCQREDRLSDFGGLLSFVRFWTLNPVTIESAGVVQCHKNANAIYHLM